MPRWHLWNKLRRLFIVAEYILKMFVVVVVVNCFAIACVHLDRHTMNNARSFRKVHVTSLDFCTKMNKCCPLACRRVNSERRTRMPQTNGTSLNKHNWSRRLMNAWETNNDRVRSRSMTNSYTWFHHIFQHGFEHKIEKWREHFRILPFRLGHFLIQCIVISIVDFRT
jgi:hypothetical protein